MVAATIVLASYVPAANAANDICAKEAESARQTMTARQAGVPIEDMMGIADKVENESCKGQDEGCKTFAKFLRTVVMLAYAKPRYSTAIYQQHAISDFANDIAEQCYITSASASE